MVESPVLYGPSFRPDGFRRIGSLEYGHAHIRHHIDYPGKVIRIDKEYEKPNRTEEFIHNQQFLQEIANPPYNIAVPRVDLAVFYGIDGAPAVLQIVDEVQGKTLGDEDIPFEPEEEPQARQAIDDLCASLVRYYRDKHVQGGQMLTDIWRADQYMWGSIEGGEKRPYLLDVGPEIDRSDLRLFMIRPGDLFREAEWYFGPLTKAREELRISLNRFPYLAKEMQSIDSALYTSITA